MEERVCVWGVKRWTNGEKMHGEGNVKDYAQN